APPAGNASSAGNGGANGTETVTSPDGRVWRRSPGGLVSALYPLLAGRSQATWVGWTGAPGPAPEPFELTGFAGDSESARAGIRIHPVPLSEQEFDEYYEGYANATIWPLYHDAVQTPVHNRQWAAANRAVNQRFAEAVDRVSPRGATVWVHDYQLQLVPAMLRERRPDLRIGFFLHIPFPPVELFMQLPWRAEIVRGLLGADLVGFHRPGGAQNFLWLAGQLIGLESSRGSVGVRSRSGIVRVGDRTVRVGAFPISIDSAGLDALARTAEVAKRAAEVRASLGNPKTMLLGVDRLDYTKGIDLRLKALHELLREGAIDPAEVTFVQLATPSRERVEHYQRMRGDIERLVSRINGEFARVGHPVVHYLHQSVGRAELAAFYRAADVMVVTPLRDGMNLVCKEYVACKHDQTGALVLSEFAGAAAELTSAFLVNPHDLDGVKRTLLAAINVDPAEGRRRMRALRRQVLTHDVDRWARSFLDALDG
ncbi:MAG: trehalose-6-phosphate synthase, partial [Thermocrispum agreste]